VVALWCDSVSVSVSVCLDALLLEGVVMHVAAAVAAILDRVLAKLVGVWDAARDVSDLLR
jgi:hypothetical protein